MSQDNIDTGKHGFWARAVDLYVDGFRSMTLGKTLWLIIAIKIFVFFVIIKILFFPNFLASKSDSDEGKAQYVREQLIDNSKN
ncbi:MAG: DUF4492 domain-containing protein [Muribaculaceae bacterium]|nr:DUF4492 domain-containing protein [Muribaculaceae bacterium]